jgi:hypothetical protein
VLHRQVLGVLDATDTVGYRQCPYLLWVGQGIIQGDYATGSGGQQVKPVQAQVFYQTV